MPPSPESADEEAEQLMQNMLDLATAAGGTAENIAFVTVYLKEGGDRERGPDTQALNKAWLKMFPDENSRPSRGLFTRAQQTSRFSLQMIAVLDN